MSTPFIPVPYTVEVQKAEAGVEDALGVKSKTWATPEIHPVCAVYTPSSEEPFMLGHDRIIVDLCVIAPVEFPAGPGDRIIVNGRPFECVGYPQDYTMGPHGWNPGVMLWTFKRVEP